MAESQTSSLMQVISTSGTSRLDEHSDANDESLSSLAGSDSPKKKRVEQEEQVDDGCEVNESPENLGNKTAARSSYDEESEATSADGALEVQPPESPGSLKQLFAALGEVSLKLDEDSQRRASALEERILAIQSGKF